MHVFLFINKIVLFSNREVICYSFMGCSVLSLVWSCVRWTVFSSASHSIPTPCSGCSSRRPPHLVRIISLLIKHVTWALATLRNIRLVCRVSPYKYSVGLLYIFYFIYMGLVLVITLVSGPLRFLYDYKL